MKTNFLRIEWPPFLARLVNYEYWPWFLFFIPLVPVWMYYAIRSGKSTYFTAANPGIPMGGLFGESKSAILDAIPERYKPTGWFVPKDQRHEIITGMAARAIAFPVIIKPNVGERGYNVRKINDIAAWQAYVDTVEDDLIVQEYIEYPIELGVMYHRFPGQSRGRVTSITEKKFLRVTGNGRDTIRQLMNRKVRAKMQISKISSIGTVNLDAVPEEGQEVLLQPIGNHCLGTTFLNGNRLISEDVHRTFDRISARFNGFHYGRFDLKIRDYDSLLTGEGIRVFEVNGVTSEPGHIYDPSYSLWQAYRDAAYHMGLVYRVSKANLDNGISHTPAREVIRLLFRHFRRKNKTPEAVPGVSSYISEQI